MKNGIVVYTIDVWQMPPVKAEAFIDKVKDTLNKDKPKDWTFMFVPTRMKGSKIQVFTFDDTNADFGELMPFLLKGQELSKIDPDKTQSEIKEFVKMMLGDPVMKLTDAVLERIDELYDESEYYGVPNHRKGQYIFDYIELEILGLQSEDEK